MPGETARATHRDAPPRRGRRCANGIARGLVQLVGAHVDAARVAEVRLEGEEAEGRGGCPAAMTRPCGGGRYHHVLQSCRRHASQKSAMRQSPTARTHLDHVEAPLRKGERVQRPVALGVARARAAALIVRARAPRNVRVDPGEEALGVDVGGQVSQPKRELPAGVACRAGRVQHPASG